MWNNWIIHNCVQ